MDWRRSPWLVGVASILLHVVGMGFYVNHLTASPDVIMAVGEQRLKSPIYSEIVSPLGPYGYDGQFYYAIAHDPFAKYGREEVDFPPGRQLRILFPALGYLASFGNAALLPYAMPAVNLLMLGLLAVLAAKWAGHHGINPWYGLTLPMVVNALMPSLRNLTDTTAMTTAFFLMYASLRDYRPVWVGVAALAAVLTREQNVAILALVIGHSLWQRRWGTAAAVAVAGAVWGGWVGWLTHTYGQWPFLPTKGNFAPPFEGLAIAWREARLEWDGLSPLSQRIVYRSGRLILPAFIAAAVVIWKQPPARRGWALVIALAAWVAILKISPVPSAVFGFLAFAYIIGLTSAWAVFALRFRRAELLALGMATGGLLLNVLGGPLIFEDYWAYGRAFFWLPMGLWILAVQAKWETALMWAGAAVYFPVCTALYH